MDAVQKKLVIAKEHGVFLINFLEKRFLWLEIAHEIANVLPSSVWITNYSGSGVLESGKNSELTLQGVATSYDELNRFITGLKTIDGISGVKPESVVSQNQLFNFLFQLTIKGVEEA